MLENINAVSDNENGGLSPAPPAEVDANQLFEEKKAWLIERKSMQARLDQLTTQLKTARQQRDELTELITPAVNSKMVVDCDDHMLARMCTAGWKPVMMSSAPRPMLRAGDNGIDPVVVTVMFERIVPDRPTPPEKRLVVADKGLSRNEPEEPEDDQQDEDEPAAARIIQYVEPLPTMMVVEGARAKCSVLPTYHRPTLNRIAAERAYSRVQAVMSGSDAS